MDKKLVSVVVTTYNHFAYISKCLESIVSQKTSFPFEIIVHDDASNDGTSEIVHEFAEKYPELIVPIIEEENQYSKGNSIGEVVDKYISGKYVALCEGDDYWCNDCKLQTQVEYMESHEDCSLCVHAAYIYDDEINMITGRVAPYSSERDCTTDEIVSSEQAGWLFVTNSVMMKSNYYLRPIDYRKWGTVGDYPMFVYCSLKGHVHFLPGCFSVYRSNSSGSWTMRMRANREADIKSSKEILQALKQFDENTDGLYHESVLKAMLHRRVMIARLEADWNQFENGEMRLWLKEQNFRTRISIWLDCHLPRSFMIKVRLYNRYIKAIKEKAIYLNRNKQMLLA